MSQRQELKLEDLMEDQIGDEKPSQMINTSTKKIAVKQFVQSSSIK